MPKIVRTSETKASRHSEYARSHKKACKTPKNEGKGFNYYHSLPAELRMMVVDEMGAVERCRFSQCSMLSSMEAKRSKNYIHSLEFRCSDEDVCIKVSQGTIFDQTFYLQFKEEYCRKYMIYLNIIREELWSTELPRDTDLVQYAANYFKDMLQKYQNSIKWLKIRSNKLHNFDFRVRNLKNLEYLELNCESQLLQVTSKLRKPLKQLLVSGEENNEELENYEISSISETLHLPHFKLNYEQLIQLSATNVSINIGGLTEVDIYKIIRNWKNQPTGGKMISYEWNFEGSDFNIPKLLRLLGEHDTERSMYIKHGFEEGKEAWLDVYYSTLKFRVQF